jgi:uncharacterized protein YjbI with pentapeptide repeats
VEPGAGLGGANLSSATLRWAVLSNADLSDADLSWADLRRADLRGADLSNAVLTGKTKLTDASWSDATIWPKDFDPLFRGADEREVRKEEEPITQTALKTIHDSLALSSSGLTADFTVTFDSELSQEQVTSLLEGLANYYRACGGTGFQIDFELEVVDEKAPTSA